MNVRAGRAGPAQNAGFQEAGSRSSGNSSIFPLWVICVICGKLYFPFFAASVLNLALLTCLWLKANMLHRFGGSSRGRTTGSGPVNRGSNPRPPANNHQVAKTHCPKPRQQIFPSACRFLHWIRPENLQAYTICVAIGENFVV